MSLLLGSLYFPLLAGSNFTVKDFKLDHHLNCSLPFQSLLPRVQLQKGALFPSLGTVSLRARDGQIPPAQAPTPPRCLPARFQHDQLAETQIKGSTPDLSLFSIIRGLQAIWLLSREEMKAAGLALQCSHDA